MRNAIVIATKFMPIMFFLGACSGPVGPIAGSKLEGSPAQWPDDWSFTHDYENFLLETNPNDPYSVTVWAVDIGSVLYVTAVDSDSQWAQNIANNPLVVVGVAGKLYAARAHEITDPNEMDPVGLRYGTKYEMSEEEGANIIDSGGIIYRLSSR